ncbi:hypothetical protein M3Y94_00312400 [Aphelenchoides besseyi]|nr:hypothetical protein M3Y94_00312400 [Aphelenchoides besseyi]
MLIRATSLTFRRQFSISTKIPNQTKSELFRYDEKNPFTRIPQTWVTTLDDEKDVNLEIINLHPDLFRAPPRVDLLHRNIVWQWNYKNLQLTKQLSKAEMPGGGAKPWPQKKTGRHHAGSIRSPHFIRGGFAHGVRGPRTWFYMLPDAIRLKGLCTALSIKHAQNDLVIVDDFGSLKSGDQQHLLDIAENRNWGYSVLFVEKSMDVATNLVDATTNLPFFNILPLFGLNCYSIVKYDTLILSRECLDALENTILKRLHSREPLQKPYRYMDLKKRILDESEHEEHPIYTPFIRIMGSYLSKKRKPIDELEAIVFKLEQLSSRCGQIQKSRYNFMWWTAVLAFFVSSSFSAMVYASNNYDEPRIVYVIVAWIAVILIFLGLKFITFRFCNFMLERHQRNIDDLKARKSEIIESVKENEKFKVAKSIIEKYGSPEDMAEMLPMNQSEMSEKRDVTIDGRRQQSPNRTAAREDTTINATSNGHQNDQTTASLQLEPHRGAMNRAFFTPAIRRQPIRPFIPPSRTPIDKILDYIVGDGPSNRFALICQQCYVHNGMCLPEEFKSMAFICFNCGMYNPARNSNGLFTPKRSITHQYSDAVEASSRPLIRTATNSDSSDSENTEDENNTERADTQT